MGEALALLALMLFSANVLVVKVVTPRLSQDIGFLIGLSTNVLFALLLFLGQSQVRTAPFGVEWDAFVMFAAGGLFTAYLGRRLFFLSVTAIGPSRASALQITNPIFAAIIGWLALGEALGSWSIVFVLAAVAGLYLTSQTPARDPVPSPVGPGDEGAAIAAPGGSPSLPRREVALALIGALSYAVGNVIRSSAVRDWDEAIFGAFLGAFSAVIAYLILHTDVRALAGRIRVADRVGLVYWALSGVLTISAQISLIAATRDIPVAVGVVVAAAIPVLVIPASVLLFHNSEAVTTRTVLGSLLIFGGVAGLLLW
ncbi:MAG: EamA family transporter [Micromonosporaceae bacterium]